MKLNQIISSTKKRRHHNNRGYATIRRGVTIKTIAEFADELSIPHPHKLYKSQKKGKVFTSELLYW